MPKNVFAAVLEEAEALGLPASRDCDLTDSTTSQLASGLATAADTVHQYDQLYDLTLQRLEQEEFSAWERLCQEEVVAERTSRLCAAATTLRTILESKDAIGRRLREASMGATIAVAPQHQGDLSALLAHASAGQEVLQTGLDALNWAAAFSERPSCWGDKLQSISDGLGAAQQQLEAMQELRDALAAQDAAAHRQPQHSPAPGILHKNAQRVVSL
jgi:hypothetical protein